MSVLRHARQPRGLLVAMHLPFLAFAAVQSVAGLGLRQTDTRWSALFLVLGAGAIQVRHSLAASRGVRPPYWQGTLLLLILIGFVPFPLFGLRWVGLQWFVIASWLMLVRRPVAIATAAADAIGIATWIAVPSSLPPGQTLLGLVYHVIILFGGGASLYSAARLVWYADELRATRAELAELAIERERLEFHAIFTICSVIHSPQSRSRVIWPAVCSTVTTWSTRPPRS